VILDWKYLAVSLLRGARSALSRIDSLDYRRRSLIVIGVFALAGVTLPAAPSASAQLGSDPEWVGTWATSPQIQMPNTTPTQFPPQTTLREIVHTSIGGSFVRVRLSNEIGTEPLVIGSAHVALRSADGSIISASDRPLTFSGQSSITIPPGAPALSDAVRLDVPPLSDLAVSLHLPNATTGSTFHGVALQTSYIAPAGADYTGATTLPTASTTTQSWFFLTAVNVAVPRRAAALVALGDSITDGVNSTPDTNHRWPNVLAERLQAAHGFKPLGVLDEGINGNRLLSEGSFAPNALKRFDRDALAQAGVEYLIVLLGINDIGHSALGDGPTVTPADLIAGYRQLIARAHEQGILAYGATLTPMGGSRYDLPAAQALRDAVNAWIRGSGEFDAVIDFDRVTRDPSQPMRLLPAYDSGDHLHPNDTGYRAMGEAIPLQLFR